MKDFDSLWHFITHRGVAVIVQDKAELNEIFDLIKGCNSYLEIGTAEGNSLYVLANALKNITSVSYVDKAGYNTEKPRDEIIRILEKQGIYVHRIHGSSHSNDSIREANAFAPYDVVMIDAGHEYEDVIADAMVYGEMARKYIVFHDITIGGVKKAFDWYVKEQNHKKTKTIILSEKFGYGVIEL